MCVCDGERGEEKRRSGWVRRRARMRGERSRKNGGREQGKEGGREGGRKEEAVVGAERVHPPQLPSRPLPCAGSRALAAPLPPAASRVLLLLRSGLRGWAVAVTFFFLPPPSLLSENLFGVGEWLFQPFILYPLWGGVSSAPSVAGRGQAGLPDFLLLHEPGRRNRCLSWGWRFFPSRSFLVAHNFLQLLPRLAREVTSR